MSDTPRTEGEVFRLCQIPDYLALTEWVPAEFARHLERERNKLYDIATKYLNMPELAEFKKDGMVKP